MIGKVSVKRSGGYDPGPRVPEILDQMTDAVLAYHPKPKSKAAKKRRRKAAKMTCGDCGVILPCRPNEHREGCSR